MKQLFAVFIGDGPGWDPAKPMENQRDWRAHADFINGLEAEGMYLLGGPLEGTKKRLFAARARSADEIHERLAGDPWVRMEMLRVNRIVPWTLRVGSLP